MKRILRSATIGVVLASSAGLSFAQSSAGPVINNKAQMKQDNTTQAQQTLVQTQSTKPGTKNTKSRGGATLNVEHPTPHGNGTKR